MLSKLKIISKKKILTKVLYFPLDTLNSKKVLVQRMARCKDQYYILHLKQHFPLNTLNSKKKFSTTYG